MSDVAISQSAARDLTDRIKVAVEGTWLLIKEAYTSRAWAVLGYGSWDAYCSAEFGTTRLRLPREERKEVVGSLRDAGLSTRAIGSALSVSVGTVHGDLSNCSEMNSTGSVLGVNGKRYLSGQPARSPEPEPPAPAPEPDRPRRRPLMDQFFDAAFDLTKAAERVDRLAGDDRFPRNAEQVAAKHRSDLLRAVDLLTAVLNRLPS